jgi:predicted transcriptional regulator
MRLPDLKAWWQGAQRAPALGHLEAELLEHVWRQGEVTVRDLHQQYAPRLAYTTLMTTLDRLHKKGLLARRKTGRAFAYSPALTRAEYAARLARDAVAGMLLQGRFNPGEVCSHFVEAISESDAALLEELARAVKAHRRRK